MHSDLEIWGGIECTLNRVGDVFFDQLKWNGHADRLEDLDLFAELGLRTIRYPLLWEKLAPHGLKEINWEWADRRLERMQELGLRPVIGLVHHGSGPAYTNLIDPDFPQKLAEYAHAVARRYPWIDAYTPINEPLTTARFSGLYGHWYPHGRKTSVFTRVLVNEIRATQMAMRAIRQVIPAARLIQTEDLGKTYSTPALDYQADFDNTRRWLSLDLLCGRLTPEHSLYDYLTWSGIPERDLSSLQKAALSPDIIGLNYYVTGERFLDERLEFYPAHTHGGNGQHRYADLEVVRVCAEGIAGAGALLTEAWERYRRPLAVTEVHLGSTREEQLRWLMDIWEDINAVRQKGIDVRAMVVWSLLGSYNWHCLVTRDDGHYEPGVFDLRSVRPRPTLLAQAVRCLAGAKSFDHPALDVPGWWRRPERLLYPPAPRRDAHAYSHAALTTANTSAVPKAKSRQPRRLLIAGASGTLAGAISRFCELRGLPYRMTGRAEMDITDPVQVERVLSEVEPWAVINAAGYVRVDQAEREPELCWRINASGPEILAQACQRRSIKLVTYSSDLVFDGKQSLPYMESRVPSPLNVYGRSKAQAEALVRTYLPAALVIRTSAFFGSRDDHNFARQVLDELAAGRPFKAAEDVFISPTYVPDLVQASLDLLLDGESGIWHLANRGEISWYEFARLLADIAGFDPDRIDSCSIHELRLPAPRPLYSVLGSERGLLLPPLEDAVAGYCHTYTLTP